MHPLLVKGFTTVPRARQEAVSLGDLNLTNNQNKQTAVYRLTIRLAHCSEFVFSHLIPRPGFEKQFKEKKVDRAPPPTPRQKLSFSLSLIDENFDCLRKLEQHGYGGGAGSQGRLLRMRGDARPLRQWLPPSYSVRQVRQDDGRDCCAMLRLWSTCHSSYSSSVSIPLSSLCLFVSSPVSRATHVLLPASLKLGSELKFLLLLSVSLTKVCNNEDQERLGFEASSLSFSLSVSC
jgi:hypothetical protein